MRRKEGLLVTAAAAALALGAWVLAGLFLNDEGSPAPPPVTQPDVQPPSNPGAYESPAVLVSPTPGVERDGGGRDTRPVATPVLGEHTPRVQGTVTAKSGEPVPSAWIEVNLVDGLGTHALGAGESQPDGQYVVGLADLATLSEVELGVARLELVASAPGFQPARRTIGLEGRELRELATDFRLDPGGRLHGRVVASTGGVEDCAGASVELLQARGEGTPQVLARVPVGPRGDFEMGFVSAGRFLVRARHPELGIAVTRVELDVLEDREVLLRLTPGGTIAGWVEDAQGRRMPGVEVVCFPEEHRDASPGHALESSLTDREDADGLLFARTRTGNEGTFELRGLRHGRFVLRLPGDPTGAVSRPFDTGERRAVLKFSAQRLRVAVVDTDGRPFAGIEVLRFADQPGGERRIRRARTDAGGVAYLPAPAAGGSTVRVMLPGRPPLERALAEGELDATFTVSAQAETGTLQIVARDGNGRAVHPLRVSLHSVRGGLPIPRLFALTPDELGTLERLPVGTYELRVRAAAEDTHFEARQIVEVIAGRVRTVELELPVGGRLRLELVAPPDYTGPTSTTDADVLQEHGARVRLDPGSQLSFRIPEDGIRGRLLPGATAVADDLLAPGEYAVEVRAPGFETVRKDVKIVAGDVADVRVELTPR